jgi:hypothetical protein
MTFLMTFFLELPVSGHDSAGRDTYKNLMQVLIRVGQVMLDYSAS